MINVGIFIISLIIWIIIFMFKPYYYTKTKFINWNNEKK